MTREWPTLTLTQPWAQLVVDGRKRWETRGWAPRLLDLPLRVAVHAAKGWSLDDREFAEELGYDPKALPLGAVVGFATIIQVMRTEERVRRGGEPAWPAPELALGDYSPGRWAWALADVERLEAPVPARGALGIWRWLPPSGDRLL